MQTGERVLITAGGSGIDECVWIYDANDKVQVAKGTCTEAQPGQFRIKLAPGK